MASCLHHNEIMKRFLLILLILVGCSSQKVSKEQGIEKQEERASYWLIDPYRFSCTRYALNIDDLSAEFEKITGAPCEVTLIDTPAGPVRSFACGDTTWFLTDSESTCQAAVGALKLPDSSVTTWMLIPGQSNCEELAGSIGQLAKGLEEETGEKCLVKRLNEKEQSARHIKCGEKNWIVSEDQPTCQRLQDFYNEYKDHNI